MLSISGSNWSYIESSSQWSVSLSPLFLFVPNAVRVLIIIITSWSSTLLTASQVSRVWWTISEASKLIPLLLIHVWVANIALPLSHFWNAFIEERKQQDRAKEISHLMGPEELEAAVYWMKSSSSNILFIFKKTLMQFPPHFLSVSLPPSLCTVITFFWQGKLHLSICHTSK